MSKPTYDQLLGALEAVLPIAECQLNWLMTQNTAKDKHDSRDAELKVARAIDLTEKARINHD